MKTQNCRLHKILDSAPHDLHVHFFCTKCNHTYCLNETPIPAVLLPDDFEMKTVNMVVKGVCPNCKG